MPVLRRIDRQHASNERGGVNHGSTPAPARRYARGATRPTEPRMPKSPGHTYAILPEFRNFPALPVKNSPWLLRLISLIIRLQRLTRRWDPGVRARFRTLGDTGSDQGDQGQRQDN